MMMRTRVCKIVLHSKNRVLSNKIPKEKRKKNVNFGTHITQQFGHSVNSQCNTYKQM